VYLRTGLGVPENRNSLACGGNRTPVSSISWPSHCMLEPVLLEVTEFVQVVRYCCFFGIVRYLASLRANCGQLLIFLKIFILVYVENVIFIVSWLQCS
jgi:hypothetical protein